MHGDLKVTQSTAIIQYLAELSNIQGSTPEKRARVANLFFVSQDLRNKRGSPPTPRLNVLRGSLRACSCQHDVPFALPAARTRMALSKLTREGPPLSPAFACSYITLSYGGAEDFEARLAKFVAPPPGMGGEFIGLRSTLQQLEAFLKACSLIPRPPLCVHAPNRRRSARHRAHVHSAGSVRDMSLAQHGARKPVFSHSRTSRQHVLRGEGRPEPWAAPVLPQASQGPFLVGPELTYADIVW